MLLIVGTDIAVPFWRYKDVLTNPIQQSTAKVCSMVYSANPSVPDEKSVKSRRDWMLSLSNSLQTSLDVNDTLSQFYQALHKVIPCGGMQYAFEAHRIHQQLGSAGKHQATYNLKIQNMSLGKLTFSRRTKFKEEELAELEAFISCLVYPLRNALLYREALQNSLRDPLTQVGNRAAMELTLKRELKLAARTGDPFSLLLIDIDHFKHLNDTAGHAFGDSTLCQVTKTLSQALRQTDLVFRYGGEEFVVLLSNTEHSAALAVAERIRKFTEALTLEHQQTPIPVTVSIGVASIGEDDNRDQLLQRADQALYTAKHNGRNQVVSEHHRNASACSALTG